MTRLAQTILVIAAVTCLVAPGALAKKYHFTPVPLGVTPQWSPVPEARRVERAPNIADLFRYGGAYYYFLNDMCYRSQGLAGPWTQLAAPPKAFYGVPAPYFRNPPGWARGKKTGWGGAPLPPGQMKKMEGGRIPPGQMKKW